MSSPRRSRDCNAERHMGIKNLPSSIKNSRNEVTSPAKTKFIEPGKMSFAPTCGVESCAANEMDTDGRFVAKFHDDAASE